MAGATFWVLGVGFGPISGLLGAGVGAGAIEGPLAVAGVAGEVAERN